MGGGRSPMDRAADGLAASGEALTRMYNATAQVLPELLQRTDRALDLAERAVKAAEEATEAQVRTSGGWRCGGCGRYTWEVHPPGGVCEDCAMERRD